MKTNYKINIQEQGVLITFQDNLSQKEMMEIIEKINKVLGKSLKRMSNEFGSGFLQKTPIPFIKIKLNNDNR